MRDCGVLKERSNGQQVGTQTMKPVSKSPKTLKKYHLAKDLKIINILDILNSKVSWGGLERETPPPAPLYFWRYVHVSAHVFRQLHVLVGRNNQLILSHNAENLLIWRINVRFLHRFSFLSTCVAQTYSYNDEHRTRNWRSKLQTCGCSADACMPPVCSVSRSLCNGH